ncbi:hypothetical protein CRG98_006445 [Punica granatum]|uniref:Retrotransposon gag domain-containing protein n=1 Tax=Punica granatum TaxID=22663 RepID=A0A2I0KXH1_PUNGR|nr:hypothetical protein CRG98_006445 [Punica granatum]
MPTRDIVVPNQFATIQSKLAILLDLRNEEIRRELQHGWEHSVRTTWLIDFIHVRSLNARGESYQHDACHGFFLLIFGTIIFPHSSNLIDGALAQVILQVIWLLAHIRPFCLSHPFSYVTDEHSLIARLLQVFRPSDRDYTDWIYFFKRLTLAQFLWAARLNPCGPMTIGCPSVIGLPLISHLGSTLVFPARVIRQLGGLQDIPIEADRTPHCFMWTYIIALLPDRVLRIREVQRVPDAKSSVQGAIRTELQSIREERDRLRCELVDIRAELTDHRELQSELAQIRGRIANQDREIACLSAMLDRARAKSKMLSYWDYEEFVIQTFQDSLMGSALDWFMTLKAGDVPTWTDLSQKFLNQYRFCAETPPTLLDLSMTEIKEGQAFEAYATEWRGRAAKHIPPITERQQVQLFHSTLRGAYYSHLLAHTSSFSDLIEAGKKLDMGVKLGRIEGPSKKKDGETSKKQTAGTSGRGKDTTIGPVNSGYQASQPISVDYTPAL